MDDRDYAMAEREILLYQREVEQLRRELEAAKFEQRSLEAKLDAEKLLRKRDQEKAQQEIGQLKELNNRLLGLSVPLHAHPEDCDSWYDGCHCLECENERLLTALRFIAGGNISPAIHFARRVLAGEDPRTALTAELSIE